MIKNLKFRLIFIIVLILIIISFIFYNLFISENFSNEDVKPNLKIDPRGDSEGKLELWDTTSDNKVIKATLTDNNECKWANIPNPKKNGKIVEDIIYVYNPPGKNFIIGLGQSNSFGNSPLYIRLKDINCKDLSGNNLSPNNLHTCWKSLNKAFTSVTYTDNNKIIGIESIIDAKKNPTNIKWESSTINSYSVNLDPAKITWTKI